MAIDEIWSEQVQTKSMDAQTDWSTPTLKVVLLLQHFRLPDPGLDSLFLNPPLLCARPPIRPLVLTTDAKVGTILASRMRFITLLSS